MNGDGKAPAVTESEIVYAYGLDIGHAWKAAARVDQMDGDGLWQRLASRDLGTLRAHDITRGQWMAYRFERSSRLVTDADLASPDGVHHAFVVTSGEFWTRADLGPDGAAQWDGCWTLKTAGQALEAARVANLNNERYEPGVTRFHVRLVAWTVTAALEWCNCEHEDHFADDGRGHGHGERTAGERRVVHVGPVCDICADGHMKEFLMEGNE